MLVTHTPLRAFRFTPLGLASFLKTNYRPSLGLCLGLHWMQPALLFSASLFLLPVRVALKLRSLRVHPSRLCRFAVHVF